VSKQKKQEFDQRDGYHRHDLCREVRLPGGYMTPGRPGRDKDKRKTPGKETWITVPVHITKAVLKDIANNDWPGSSNYKSNENIASATGLPLRSIAKGVAVLKAEGILRRTQREGRTYSRLDWDLMLTLREKFKPVKSVETPDPDVPDDLDDELRAIEAEDAPADFDDDLETLKPEDVDDEGDTENDISDLGPQVTMEDAATGLIDLVMKFGPYHRLRHTVETVIKGMLKTQSADDIQAAWESLENWRRAKVVSPDTKNSGGYLRDMLTNAIDDVQQEAADAEYGYDDSDELKAYLLDVSKTARAGEPVTIPLGATTDDDAREALIRWTSAYVYRANAYIGTLIN
jgi:hypothetical protein